VRCVDPYVYVKIRDLCWVTTQFLSNGKVRSVPQAIGVGINSGINESAGATVTFYGSTWTGTNYVRGNQFFQMTETPYQSATSSTGKFLTTYPQSGGTNVSMSPSFDFQAAEGWNPNPSGVPHVNTYYCRPTPGTSGTYNLLNSWTPQNHSLWYDMWPDVQHYYSVNVTKSTTFAQLPDSSLLQAAQSALAQVVNAQYLGFTYDPSTIGSMSRTSTISHEVVEFGSMNSTVFPQPWNMCCASASP
jgi:hypothetical protein